MKFLKIFFSIILILAVLVFLVAPPLLGLLAKTEYTKVLAEISKRNPNLKTTLLHYDFGWYHSKALIRVEYHKIIAQDKEKNASPNSSIQMTGQLDMYHGPIIFTKRQGKRHVYFALAEIKGSIPKLNLTNHTIWHFNNVLVSQFSSPYMNLSANNMTLLLRNLQGSSIYHIATHRMKVNCSIDLFEISNFINLKKITYFANITPQGLINYGNQQLKIDSLLFLNKKNNLLTLNNIVATTNTTHHKGHTNMAFNYAVQSISDNALDINSVQMDVAVKNMNATNTNTFLQALQDQESSQTLNYQNLFVPLMNLLRSGLTIQINYIHIKTKDGAVTLNGDLLIPKLDKDTTLLQIPMAMKAHFYFQAPQSWIKKQMTLFIGTFQQSTQHYYQTPRKDPKSITDQTLQQWENQKLLLPTGDNYKARIEYEQGHLYINGKIPYSGPKDKQNKQEQSP